jgi:DNA-directed RNA polymerase specialized sigma24 family protein
MRRLYAMLDRIEPHYRIAYTLHVVDGRPMKEVASAMGCSTIAAKNRVWRARGMVHARALRDPVLAEFLPKGAVVGKDELE